MATEVTVYGVPTGSWDDLVEACGVVDISAYFDTNNPITVGDQTIYVFNGTYDYDAIFAALDKTPDDPDDDDPYYEAASAIMWLCQPYTYIKSNQGTGPNS